MMYIFNHVLVLQFCGIAIKTKRDSEAITMLKLFLKKGLWTLSSRKMFYVDATIHYFMKWFKRRKEPVWSLGHCKCAVM